jgi:hypothetical protein
MIYVVKPQGEGNIHGTIATTFYCLTRDYNQQLGEGLKPLAHNLPLKHTYLYNLSFSYTKLITLIVSPFFC